jgi:hypothetical protein
MVQTLLWVGFILCFFGGLWIIVLAWQKGVIWGLGCLLFPLLQFVYVAFNWRQAKSAFFLLLTGLAALVASSIIAK